MSDNVNKRFLSSDNAAKLLCYSQHTMKQSRCTGKLAGVDAPPHKKMGRRVLYEIAVLETWVSQFEERVCTK